MYTRDPYTRTPIPPPHLPLPIQKVNQTEHAKERESDERGRQKGSNNVEKRGVID